MKIEFGILTKKLLILLLYPIFILIRQFFLGSETSPLYGYFTSSISYLLAGPLYLLILHVSKNRKKLSAPKNPEGKHSIVDQLYLENQKILKRRKFKKKISIFLLTLINILRIIVETLLLTQKQINDIYEKFPEQLRALLTILFYIFFSKIILNSKIYKHQFISLSMIFFCLLILLFKNLEVHDIVIFDLAIALLCYIEVYAFFVFYHVLVKKHFETHSNDPYHLMFFVGLFSFILIIPLDLFAYFYNKESKIFELEIINQIKSLYEENKQKFFLKLIFDIISRFIYLAGIILTLYHFTPCHVFISVILLHFLSKITDWKSWQEIVSNNWYQIPIYFLLYSIAFFSSLIYNEIIIIHLWSMERNTFKYISLRQSTELEFSLKSDIENLTQRNTTSSNSSFDDNYEKKEE